MTDYINPTRESFALFRNMKRKGPFQMLNLIRLNKQAQYEDCRDVSGKAAYKTYGRETSPIFKGLGGRIIWSGRPEVMVIGPEDREQWDIAFIAEYPDINAFIAMIRDPAYQALTYHRTAAVNDSRLIRMAAVAPGEGFGE